MNHFNDKLFNQSTACLDVLEKTKLHQKVNKWETVIANFTNTCFHFFYVS